MLPPHYCLCHIDAVFLMISLYECRGTIVELRNRAIVCLMCFSADRMAHVLNFLLRILALIAHHAEQALLSDEPACIGPIFAMQLG
jgi:hypothetical protein